MDETVPALELRASQGKNAAGSGAGNERDGTGV